MSKEDLAAIVNSLLGGKNSSGQLLKLVGYVTNEDTKSQSIDYILSSEVLKECRLIFDTRDRDGKLQCAELIAEIAKIEKGRLACLESNLVPGLMSLLRFGKCEEVIEACRALGNMCFDCEKARRIIDENEGIAALLGILRENLCSRYETSDKLRTVALGFLLNLTNDNESIQEKVCCLGAIDILQDYLNEIKDESTLRMLLNVITGLVDTDMCRDAILKRDFIKMSSELLTKKDVDPEIILEFLSSLCNSSDDAKLQLAMHCKNLLSVLERYSTNEEDIDILKSVTDLIVLLFAGEKSLKEVYKNGEGTLYREAIKWLQSDVEQLQCCGVLVIGNVATNDEQSISLVKQGVVSKLLNLLLPDPQKISDDLQHAIFSTLRNLSVPVENKQALINAGLLKVALQFYDSNLYVVQFKLIAMIRLLIDGQSEASSFLIKNVDFTKKIISLTDVQTHSGVQAESSRLLARLIKNSKDVESLSIILENDGLKPLENMMICEHDVMKNEALMAIIILANVLKNNIGDKIDKSNIMEGLKTLFDEKESLYIILNGLTLLNSILSHDKLKSKAKSLDIENSIKSLPFQGDEQFKVSSNVAYSLLK
ncbi:DgyrCDS5021 [Dimorphilus gyrociliatus]|uniref:DgyrCDS5021 n=1 Tax=Dimorphilus gyrociliatus TaxID=2664684 RepID=A0A7I8VIJ9_9ANNE|nr:DgyrCDS5021 [Dimorphilus gyrociliatus]